MSETGLQPNFDSDLDHDFLNPVDHQSPDDLDYWKTPEDEAIDKALEEAADKKVEKEKEEETEAAAKEKENEAAFEAGKSQIQALYPGHTIQDGNESTYTLQKVSEDLWVMNGAFGRSEMRRDSTGQWMSGEKGQEYSVQDPEQRLLALAAGSVENSMTNNGGVVEKVVGSKTQNGSETYTVKSKSFKAFSAEQYHDDSDYEPTSEEAVTHNLATEVFPGELVPEEKTPETEASVATVVEQAQDQQQNEQQGFWNSLFNDVPNPLLQVEADVIHQEITDTVEVSIPASSEEALATSSTVSEQPSPTVVEVSQGVSSESVAEKVNPVHTAEVSKVVKTTDVVSSFSASSPDSPVTPGLIKPEVKEQSEETKNQTAAVTVKKVFESNVGINTKEIFERFTPDKPPTPDAPLPEAPAEKLVVTTEQGFTLNVEQRIAAPEVQERIQELLITEPSIAPAELSIQNTHEVAAMFPIELTIAIPFQGTVEKQTMNEVIASLVEAPVATEVVIVGEKDYQEKPKDITVFTKQESGEIRYEFIEAEATETREVINTQWEEVKQEKKEENKGEVFTSSAELREAVEERSRDKGAAVEGQIFIEKNDAPKTQPNSAERLVLTLNRIPIDALDDQDTKTPDNKPQPAAQEAQYQMAA